MILALLLITWFGLGCVLVVLKELSSRNEELAFSKLVSQESDVHDAKRLRLMHRRAQKAEGELLRLRRKVWKSSASKKEVEAAEARGYARAVADVVAWHKAQSEFVWDAHDNSATEIAAGAHVGAAKKEGAP